MVLNWRDKKNPSAGGAELYTHEIFSRLVNKYDYQVTVFTSQFVGSQENDNVDGVEVVRSGGRFSVFREARAFYEKHKIEFDIVIDEINTRPFGAPSFVREGCPVIAIIHQLAREYWWYETPFPVSALGFFFLENQWLKKYRKIATVTVSNSTLEELVRMGFTNLTLIPNGVSVSPLDSLPKKSDQFTAVFLARLSKVKRPEDAIKAFLMADLGTSARLIIIGEGRLRRKLSQKYSRYGNIAFLGHVSDARKIEVLKEAHVHLAPYVREGWGNTIMEASALGTPSIGYSTYGLVDSIVDLKTGLLVPKFNLKRLSESIEFAYSNPQEMRHLATNGLDWARQFSWDQSAEKFHLLIEGTLRGSTPKTRRRGAE